MIIIIIASPDTTLLLQQMGWMLSSTTNATINSNCNSSSTIGFASLSKNRRSLNTIQRPCNPETLEF
jgi:hypothetical protein